MEKVNKNYGLIKNYGNGQFLDSDAEKIDIYSPLDGSIIGQTYSSGMKELDEIVQKAKEAQPKWAALSMKSRSQVMYKYRELLLKNRDELAEINHIENGKTLDEAYGGVDKAIEIVEYACSIPSTAPNRVQMVSRGVECKTEYVPLGVVSSITPFNFPVMVPHWTTPQALMMGNAVVLKPSELTPICAAKMGELLKEAGLPDGIFNVVNGGKDIVEAICDHPDIKAISFVGSTPVAEIVYKRASSSLKRVLALGGAKNHLIVTPDAHTEMASNDILAAATGMAGQRCMAASVVIAVGDSDHIVKAICEKAEKLIPGDTMSTIISEAAIAKIVAYLERVEKAGAKILVDGRKFKAKYDNGGYFFGPSVIDYRGTNVEMPAEEIFGPTLEILGAENIQEAFEIQNKSPYGNATSIFTQNGRIAMEAASMMGAGMCGVNIGVPVPRDPFSFGGIKGSKYGHGDITGESSLEFWANLRKLTTKWNPEDKTDWMS